MSAAVIEYIRRARALEEAEAAVNAARALFERRLQETREQWLEVRRQRTSCGVYRDGPDCIVIVDGVQDHPELLKWRG